MSEWATATFVTLAFWCGMVTEYKYGISGRKMQHYRNTVMRFIPMLREHYSNEEIYRVMFNDDTAKTRRPDTKYD